MEIHRSAGAGWDDNGQLAGENTRRVAGNFARGGPVAGVEGGLATTGLVIGKFNGHAEVFEDFHGGLGDVIIEGVAKAGAHEKHAFVERAGDRIGHGEVLLSRLWRESTAATRKTGLFEFFDLMRDAQSAEFEKSLMNAELNGTIAGPVGIAGTAPSACA